MFLRTFHPSYRSYVTARATRLAGLHSPPATTTLRGLSWSNGTARPFSLDCSLRILTSCNAECQPSGSLGYRYCLTMDIVISCRAPHALRQYLPWMHSTSTLADSVDLLGHGVLVSAVSTRYSASWTCPS